MEFYYLIDDIQFTFVADFVENERIGVVRAEEKKNQPETELEKQKRKFSGDRSFSSYRGPISRRNLLFSYCARKQSRYDYVYVLRNVPCFEIIRSRSFDEQQLPKLRFFDEDETSTDLSNGGNIQTPACRRFPTDVKRYSSLQERVELSPSISFLLFSIHDTSTRVRVTQPGRIAPAIRTKLHRHCPS